MMFKCCNISQNISLSCRPGVMLSGIIILWSLYPTAIPNRWVGMTRRIPNNFATFPAFIVEMHPKTSTIKHALYLVLTFSINMKQLSLLRQRSQKKGKSFIKNTDNILFLKINDTNPITEWFWTIMDHFGAFRTIWNHLWSFVNIFQFLRLFFIIH